MVRRKTGGAFVPRRARLALSLLGALLVGFLGGYLVRSETAERPVRDQPDTWERPTPQAAGRTPAPARGDGGDGGPLPHGLAMPVAGVDPATLRDDFGDARGGARTHGAIDIAAPRGTPVHAVDDGTVRKLFTSVPGGLTVYQFDLESRYCYYYAHLDGYAAGLAEGQALRRGDVIGYVGTTGNAPKDAPHLHFAVSRLQPDRRWWTGTPIDPYPLLVRAP